MDTNVRQKWNRGSSIRIVSWNINGIQPFVQDYLQRTLHSFFKPSSTEKKSAKRQHSPGDSDDDNDLPSDDPAKEGKPSLRKTLWRQQWPEILFLQEIKIKPGDEKTMDAVRLAVNDPVSPDNKAAAGFGAGPGKAALSHTPTDTLLTDGGPPYDAHFVLPSDPHNARGFGGKVYGVAAVVRRDFMQKHVECIREPLWDREGRVQIIETRDFGSLEQWEGSDSASRKSSLPAQAMEHCQFKLAVINIYAVNGTFNPYHSTHTGAVTGTRHDRKLAMHTELLQEAHALESRGFSVVIAGDLNVAREHIDGHPNLRTLPHQHVLNRADFNQKFFSSKALPSDTPRVSQARYSLARLHSKGEREELEGRPVSALRGLNGIDTFRHVNGDLRKYSWHSRTREWGTCCDRVDLILASRSLGDNIADAGICDNSRDRGPSDHCPVWVDISRKVVSEEADT